MYISSQNGHCRMGGSPLTVYLNIELNTGCVVFMSNVSFSNFGLYRFRSLQFFQKNIFCYMQHFQVEFFLSCFSDNGMAQHDKPLLQ